MSAVDTVVEVRPARTEIAVVHLPAGGTVRVHHPGGTTRDVAHLDAGDPLVAAVPGDRAVIGWGVVYTLSFGLAAVRNGHHRLDRPVWHQAARAVKGGGVVYVQLEQREYYGKPRWTAVGLRAERGAA